MGVLYGSRDKNQFQPGGSLKNNKYYTTVNSTTGEIRVRRIGNPLLLQGDSIVATKKPGEDWNVSTNQSIASIDEQRWLRQSANQKQLLEHARKTSNRAQQELGVTPEKAKIRTEEILKTGKATTETGTADPPAPEKDNDGNVKVTPKDLEKVAGESQGRKKYNNGGSEAFRYPLDLHTQQDQLKIDMLEYQPGEFNEGTFGFARPSERRTKKNILGTVFLPVPGGISDTTSAKWSDSEMNAAEIGASQIALGGITGGAEGMTKALENQIQSLQKGSDEAAQAIASAIADSAVGGGGGILTRTTGAVLNPNLELLFNGPSLRSFSFTYKMSARSPNEAKAIIKIIRFFKQGMAPQKSSANLFLKTPNVFQLKYIRGGNDKKANPYLNKFKECALTSVQTEYTPEGTYATFYDGPMVSYQITLQFQELEPIFNSDYDGESGSEGDLPVEIGF